MGVFDKVFSVLSGIGKVAKSANNIVPAVAPIVSIINPAVGAGMLAISGAIAKAQLQHGAGAGPAKHAQVLNEATPDVIRMVEALVGANKVNEELMK